jgi:hypothetical protein
VQNADVALAQRKEFDVGKLQPLEQRRDVFLITREAVERFSDYDIKFCFARALHHRLIAGPKRRRAADGRVAIDLDQCPALALDSLLAEPDLVVDRRRALLVG